MSMKNYKDQKVIKTKMPKIDEKIYLKLFFKLLNKTVLFSRLIILVIHTDFKCLLKKINNCQTNPGRSYTTTGFMNRLIFFTVQGATQKLP